MGINIKKKSWGPVIADNRKNIKPCPCQELSAHGSFCLIHGRFYTGDQGQGISGTPNFNRYLEKQRTLGSSAMGQKFYKGPIKKEE